VPGCSSGLYGSHMNSCKTVPKNQVTGQRGLLSHRALAEQNSATENLADTFVCNKKWQVLEQKIKPMPECKERAFGEAPARNSSRRPQPPPRSVSGDGQGQAVRVPGSPHTASPH